MFLYEETGSGICVEDRFVTILDGVDDDVWLVPATPPPSREESTIADDRRELPNIIHLECRACDRETCHRFLTFEDVLDDTWAGQPL